MVIMRISNKTTKNMNVHIITIITLSVRQLVNVGDSNFTSL